MSDIIVVGSYIQDLAFLTPVFPAPGETRIGSFRTGPGGKGFNQAVAAHRQAAQTLFLGAVGADLFADGVREFATKEGLRVEFEVHSECSTGAASIVVNEKAENLIVVALGASDCLSPQHIQRFEDEIAGAQVVVCQAECNLAAVEKAFSLARQHGVRTIFNPAPINSLLSSELLSLADIITPNETEFLFLCEKLLGITLEDRYWEKPPDELHRICEQCRVPTVILTLGSNGCFVSHNREVQAQQDCMISDSSDYYFEPAIDVTPIDTTGAGDAFSGGLAAGIIRYPSSLRDAVHYACSVAGLSTQKEGTAPAMPTAAEVNEVLGLKSASNA